MTVIKKDKIMKRKTEQKHKLSKFTTDSMFSIVSIGVNQNNGSKSVTTAGMSMSSTVVRNTHNDMHGYSIKKNNN